MFVTKAFAQAEPPPPPPPPGGPEAHGAAPPPPPGAPPAPPAPHGEAEAHTEVAHEGAFPPFNPEYYPSQILWLAITFGVFFYVLKKTILPQIGGVLENRRERIAGDVDAAEKMRSDADAARAAYEQELAEARSRSAKIAGDARDKAKSDADAERKRTEGELDSKLDAAQARISEIKNRALAEVGQIAEDVTQSILADVAKIDVSREEAAGAVERVRG